MPKKKKSKFPKVILWFLIISLIALMIVSFAPTQNMTEIIVYP